MYIDYSLILVYYEYFVGLGKTYVRRSVPSWLDGEQWKFPLLL